MNPLAMILAVAAVASVSGHAHLPGFRAGLQQAHHAAHQKPFPAAAAGFHSGVGHHQAAYHPRAQQPVYPQVQQPAYPAPPPPPPQKPSPVVQYGYSHQTGVDRRPRVNPPPAATAASQAQFVNPAAAPVSPAQYANLAVATGPARYVNPAAAGQAQYANPAAVAASQAQYANPAAAVAGQAQYANPATGHAQYANPAAAAASQAQYANLAAAAAGRAQYANPAAAAPAGQAQYANPAAAAGGYGQYANPPAYGYNNVVTTTPVPIDSQYQRLDQYGQYSFGFSGGESDRTETRDAQGNVQGSYTYIDSNGKPQTQHYVADKYGFRVTGTNLPKGPEALASDPSVAAVGPLPVQDTPEVAAAKAKFKKAFEEAALLAKEAPDTPAGDY